jgi:hypothetical protein
MVFVSGGCSCQRSGLAAIASPAMTRPTSHMNDRFYKALLTPTQPSTLWYKITLYWIHQKHYDIVNLHRMAMPRITRSFIRSANAGDILRQVERVASQGAFEDSHAVPATRRVSGKHHDEHSQQAECMASHMSRAATSALPEISARHMSMLLRPPKQAATCRGVQLLKEQNIRS